MTPITPITNIQIAYQEQQLPRNTGFLATDVLSVLSEALTLPSAVRVACYWAAYRLMDSPQTDPHTRAELFKAILLIRYRMGYPANSQLLVEAE